MKQFLTLLFLFAVFFHFANKISAQTQAPTPSIIVRGRSDSETAPLSLGVVNGKAVNLVTPPYPGAAKAVGASGAVNVQVTIDENGNIVSAAAVSGHPLLRQAAEQAARASKFSPTLLAGKAVRVTGIIVYNFVNSDAPNIPEGPFRIAMNPKIARTEWIRWSAMLAYIAHNKNSNADSETVLLATVFPNELVSEKELLKKLPFDPQNRGKIVADVYNLLRSKYNGSEAWQIEAGKALGELNHQIGSTIFDESFSLDLADVRQNLLKIRELSKTVPPDFPVDLKEPLGKLAGFAEDKNLTGADSLIAMMRSLQKIFRSISEVNIK